MTAYTYKCRYCFKVFSLNMTIKEYVEDDFPVKKCPHCLHRLGFRIIDLPTVIYRGEGFTLRKEPENVNPS